MSFYILVYILLEVFFLLYAKRLQLFYILETAQHFFVQPLCWKFILQSPSIAPGAKYTPRDVAGIGGLGQEVGGWQEALGLPSGRLEKS